MAQPGDEVIRFEDAPAHIQELFESLHRGERLDRAQWDYFARRVPTFSPAYLVRERLLDVGSTNTHGASFDALVADLDLTTFAFGREAAGTSSNTFFVPVSLEDERPNFVRARGWAAFMKLHTHQAARRHNVSETRHFYSTTYVPLLVRRRAGGEAKEEWVKIESVLDKAGLKVVTKKDAHARDRDADGSQAAPGEAPADAPPSGSRARGPGPGPKRARPQPVSAAELDQMVQADKEGRAQAVRELARRGAAPEARVLAVLVLDEEEMFIDYHADGDDADGEFAERRRALAAARHLLSSA